MWKTRVIFNPLTNLVLQAKHNRSRESSASNTEKGYTVDFIIP